RLITNDTVASRDGFEGHVTTMENFDFHKMIASFRRMQTFMKRDACHQRSQFASAAVKFIF
ncbi:MAG TPA: hypothetical protein VMH28_32425, partial [Candidatus Acidoferrales bacterium]|nr:hypothetical protein [Candidatus Acidoferrales bacterium]